MDKCLTAQAQRPKGIESSQDRAVLSRKTRETPSRTKRSRHAAERAQRKQLTACDEEALRLRALLYASEPAQQDRPASATVARTKDWERDGEP